jgi:flagellar motility protein MotE (MotC chaperone)
MKLLILIWMMGFMKNNEIIMDELFRSQKYHIRQLQENLNDIRNKEESIELLKKANEKHLSVIEAIDQHIEKLKEGDKNVQTD